MSLNHISLDTVPYIRELKQNELMKIFFNKDFSSEKVHYVLNSQFDIKFHTQ